MERTQWGTKGEAVLMIYATLQGKIYLLCLHQYPVTHTVQARSFLFVPVGPCGLSQCCVSSGRPDHGRPENCLYSSQMLHHCLWPTATRQRKRGRANHSKEIRWSYLPGYVSHWHIMLLHAGLATIIWRVSYLIGGGGRTVDPPLGTGRHEAQWQHGMTWLSQVKASDINVH